MSLFAVLVVDVFARVVCCWLIVVVVVCCLLHVVVVCCLLMVVVVLLVVVFLLVLLFPCEVWLFGCWLFVDGWLSLCVVVCACLLCVVCSSFGVGCSLLFVDRCSSRVVVGAWCCLCFVVD